MSPERKQRRFHPLALRFWLVSALVLLLSALILGANLALLGYAQPRNDPVGQLTPARLAQIQRAIHEDQSPETALVKPPARHVTTVTRGEESDD